MSNGSDIAALRTKLRGVNIEYSALLKGGAAGGRLVRMAELRIERHALMALIAARTACAPNEWRLAPQVVHSAGLGFEYDKSALLLGPTSPASRTLTRFGRLWRPWAPGDVVARLRFRTRSIAHSLRGLARRVREPPLLRRHEPC
jgi:hypothetical protein